MPDFAQDYQYQRLFTLMTLIHSFEVLIIFHAVCVCVTIAGSTPGPGLFIFIFIFIWPIKQIQRVCRQSYRQLIDFRLGRHWHCYSLECAYCRENQRTYGRRLAGGTP
ncbi:hypothetical protein Y032_0473g2114 [Ancylostoma ceylanicum]|uniref:Uncharacterized protein n=1 Tax=Ancylostoma ceylanicum TaxID=53326 RepID=A0A016WWB1_9BILA|nr:hypothetical protein Y032_0473g2114 [Ancylostoma ceylanicum]